MFISTGFPGGSVIKNPPADAGDARDIGLIPESGRSPGKVNNNLLLAWDIPWRQEPGELQSVGSQESDTTDSTAGHPETTISLLSA